MPDGVGTPPSGAPGRVLITGATGFVGRAALRRLAASGAAVRLAVRDPRGFGHDLPPGEVHPVGEIGAGTDWSAALEGVDAVLHLAARAHVMRERAADPAARYHEVNALGTERLARMAAAAGVRRMVFVSSVKVHGEGSAPGCAFREDDPPRPQDAYAASKLEAERRLHRVARETGLEAVVVRPPLVYGPGVKGNLLVLMRWIARGIPLPVGAVENRRSLVGLDNLADLLAVALEHPSAAGETFLAADGEDLSTPELVRRLAAGLGRPARLLPVPTRWLRAAGRLAGREGAIERLCGSLRVDAGKAERMLGWRAPGSTGEGLEAMARWYLTYAQHGPL